MPCCVLCQRINTSLRPICSRKKKPLREVVSIAFIMQQLRQNWLSLLTFTLPTFSSLCIFGLPCCRLELVPEPLFKYFYFSNGKHQAAQHLDVPGQRMTNSISSGSQNPMYTNYAFLYTEPYGLSLCDAFTKWLQTCLHIRPCTI